MHTITTVTQTSETAWRLVQLRGFIDRYI
jgi:hypothetical protein